MSDSLIEQAIASGWIPDDIPTAYLYISRDAQGIAGIIFVLVLTSSVVICRLLSRAFIIKRFGIDDGIALASLLTFIPFATLCIEMIRGGAGRHFAYRDFVVDLETYTKIQMFDTISHIIYGTALVLCRISGLAFYYRLCRLYNEFLIAIKIVFGILVLGYLAQTSLIVFHCWPISMFWEAIEPNSPEVDALYCLNWGDVYTANSAISLFCDFLLFGIPIAMLRVLKKMPRKQKVQLACILLPGIAVVGITICRLVLVILWPSETDDDFRFIFLSLLAIEVSEVGATLIALSIPGLKPLVDKFSLRKGSKTNSSSTFSRRPKNVNFGQNQRNPLSKLSMLSIESMHTGHMHRETEVSASSQKWDTKQDGICVTVDFQVQDDVQGQDE